MVVVVWALFRLLTSRRRRPAGGGGGGAWGPRWVWRRCAQACLEGERGCTRRRLRRRLLALNGGGAPASSRLHPLLLKSALVF